MSEDLMEKYTLRRAHMFVEERIADLEYDELSTLCRYSSNNREFRSELLNDCIEDAEIQTVELEIVDL
jgi:hypothetical protein